MVFDFDSISLQHAFIHQIQSCNQKLQSLQASANELQQLRYRILELQRRLRDQVAQIGEENSNDHLTTI